MKTRSRNGECLKQQWQPPNSYRPSSTTTMVVVVRRVLGFVSYAITPARTQVTCYRYYSSVNGRSSIISYCTNVFQISFIQPAVQ